MKLAQTACSDIVEEDSFSSSVASVLQMKKMEATSNLHSPVESEVCIHILFLDKTEILMRKGDFYTFGVFYEWHYQVKIMNYIFSKIFPKLKWLPTLFFVYYVFAKLDIHES